MGSRCTMRRAPWRFTNWTPMPGAVPPGITITRRGPSSSGICGNSASMAMPSGIFIWRMKPGSVDSSEIVFSFGAMTISTGCWRRSARSTAAFRMVETESVAERMRTLSIPAATDGYEMPASRPMMVTTTSISMSVMPERPVSIFPADQVGIQAITARLAVSAETDDVGLVTVLAGIFVDVLMAPRIFRNFLGHVRPVPLIEIARLDAQRLQALFGRRERSGVELVGAERGLKILNLRARRRDARLR